MAPPSSKVPPIVLERLDFTLSNLRQIEADFKRIQRLDSLFGPKGMLIAETWRKIQPQITQSIESITDFRKYALKNGVNAEAVIDERGGLPEFLLPPEAQPWIDNPGKGAVEFPRAEPSSR